MTDGAEAGNDVKGHDPGNGNEVDQGVAVTTTTEGADQVEKIAGTADQAVAEAVVIQVMKKDEEVEKIKRVQPQVPRLQENKPKRK